LGSQKSNQKIKKIRIKTITEIDFIHDLVFLSTIFDFKLLRFILFFTTQKYLLILLNDIINLIKTILFYKYEQNIIKF
ncbi:MAG: hypothetical protein K2O21_02860, partial [Malacoplasma sp.]|nr:hypothetical protein [Malacoplasma sp.]